MASGPRRLFNLPSIPGWVLVLVSWLYFGLDAWGNLDFLQDRWKALMPSVPPWAVFVVVNVIGFAWIMGAAKLMGAGTSPDRITSTEKLDRLLTLLEMETNKNLAYRSDGPDKTYLDLVLSFLRDHQRETDEPQLFDVLQDLSMAYGRVSSYRPIKSDSRVAFMMRPSYERQGQAVMKCLARRRGALLEVVFDPNRYPDCMMDFPHLATRLYRVGVINNDPHKSLTNVKARLVEERNTLGVGQQQLRFKDDRPPWINSKNGYTIHPGVDPTECVDVFAFRAMSQPRVDGRVTEHADSLEHGENTIELAFVLEDIGRFLPPPPEQYRFTLRIEANDTLPTIKHFVVSPERGIQFVSVETS